MLRPARVPSAAVERAVTWTSEQLSAVLDAAAGAAPLWLALGVALHLLGQLARAQAWYGVLAATWPRSTVPRRPVLAAHVGCSGLGELLSPRGADLLRLAVVRRRLGRGPVTLPALAGTVLVEGVLETVVGVALTAWVVSLGLERAGADGGLAPVLLAAGGAVAALALLRSRWRERLARVARELRRGLAILGRPRTFVTRVLSWQAVSRALRLAALACFLAAFALPVTAAAVALLAVVVGSGRALPLPAVGTGAAAGLLVASFAAVTGIAGRGADVAALALVMPALLAVLGLALAVPLLGGVLGVRSPRRLVAALLGLRREARPAPVEAPAPAPAPS